MKAMGIESDQEAVQLVGQDQAYASLLAPTLEECRSLHLYTQQHALDWLGEHCWMIVYAQQARPTSIHHLQSLSGKA